MEQQQQQQQGWSSEHGGYDGGGQYGQYGDQGKEGAGPSLGGYTPDSSDAVISVHPFENLNREMPN